MSDTTIKLPQPDTTGSVPLETAIAKRRSVRRYTTQELTIEQIGQLLWAAQGITGGKDVQRAAPSAGGLHPLLFYVARSDGLWAYDHQEHALVRHTEGDVRVPLAEASWGQKFIAEAPCVIVVSAIMERTTRKYKERGEVRYVPMDAGHAAQNILLQAVALDLASVPVGAFVDKAVTGALSLPEPQVPLYILPVGHPR